MYLKQIKKKFYHIAIFFSFTVIFITVVFSVYAQTGVSNRVITRVGDPTEPAPGGDGTHSCPLQVPFTPFPAGSYAAIPPGSFSFVCAHCRPIINANDLGVAPAGGVPVFAVVSGTVDDITNPVGGPALWLTGDDNQNYYYAHLKREGHVTGRVTSGQQIGIIAANRESYPTGNNGVAHLHISAGTPGNGQSFNNPANIPIGPLIDSWCGTNVCHGQPNRDASCGT